MSNLNDRLVKGLLTRANTRLDEANGGGGGGEVWEKVNISQTESYNDAYYTHIPISLINSTLRVTYETYSGGLITGSTITQPITQNRDEQYICVNNIKAGENTFTGVISFFRYSTLRVALTYGTRIENENERPKILKIERLV